MTSKHTTTVQIPEELAKAIKEAGMTYTGALQAGWEAMQERKQWNVEMAELRENMDKYRAGYFKLEREMKLK